MGGLAMVSLVPGVEVGHWSDPSAATGVSVVLFPEGAIASGEVRGGAPGTREWELLAPERMMSRIDAVVLAGGSAYGLASCDGVARWCEEHSRGSPTPAGVVPIVVGAVVYDLGVGDPARRPGPDEGYAACEAARPASSLSTAATGQHGRIGAGCGTTVGSWRGEGAARPGGMGESLERHGELLVGALVVANCYGDVIGQGERLPPIPEAAFRSAGSLEIPPSGQNTTIGVVATNARLSKVECFLVAQSAHDGLARAVEPVHTLADGDAFVAVSTGRVEAPVDMVRVLEARAVSAAVRRAIEA